MSSIATCPQCAAQLAVPETASAGDHAQCPECRAEFLLAEADLRYLTMATIIDPPEMISPVTSPTRSEPEQDENSQTIELPPDTTLPATKYPAVEVPEMVEPETFSSAETVSSTSPLAGWEERLRTAIDSTETESSDEPKTAEPAAEGPSLEKSPEFEFEMDPPVESPTGNVSSAATSLPETKDWFEPTAEQLASDVIIGEFPSAAEHEATDDVQPDASQSALPRRRKKSSLLIRAIVVVVFGAVGLILGQYALLWLRGPSADYLHIAQFVPSAIFPPPQSQVFSPQISPDSTREQLVADSETPKVPESEKPTQDHVTIAETEPIEREPEVPETPAVTRDESVQPATVQMPEVNQPPELGPLPSTNTTPADFGLLLSAAQNSASALVEGDLSTNPSASTKGHAYMAFCELAEHFDFVHNSSSDAEVENLNTSAQALFRWAAGQTNSLNDLAWITTRWWDHQARPNQGIFLVGRIQDSEDLGSRDLCQVAVVHATSSKLIPVLLPAGDHQVGDQIGVVGTIVTDPRTAIPGFSVDLPQLAVAQDSFAVPLQ